MVPCGRYYLLILPLLCCMSCSPTLFPTLTDACCILLFVSGLYPALISVSKMHSCYNNCEVQADARLYMPCHLHMPATSFSPLHHHLDCWRHSCCPTMPLSRPGPCPKPRPTPCPTSIVHPVPNDSICSFALQGTGKTTWAAETAKKQAAKRYLTLGTNLVMEQMRVGGSRREDGQGG